MITQYIPFHEFFLINNIDDYYKQTEHIRSLFMNDNKETLHDIHTCYETIKDMKLGLCISGVSDSYKKMNEHIRLISLDRYTNPDYPDEMASPIVGLIKYPGVELITDESRWNNISEKVICFTYTGISMDCSSYNLCIRKNIVEHGDIITYKIYTVEDDKRTLEALFIGVVDNEEREEEEEEINHNNYFQFGVLVNLNNVKYIEDHIQGGYLRSNIYHTYRNCHLSEIEYKLYFQVLNNYQPFSSKIDIVGGLSTEKEKQILENELYRNDLYLDTLTGEIVMHHELDLNNIEQLKTYVTDNNHKPGFSMGSSLKCDTDASEVNNQEQTNILENNNETSTGKQTVNIDHHLTIDQLYELADKSLAFGGLKLDKDGIKELVSNSIIANADGMASSNIFYKYNKEFKNELDPFNIEIPQDPLDETPVEIKAAISRRTYNYIQSIVDTEDKIADIFPELVLLTKIYENNIHIGSFLIGDVMSFIMQLVFKSFWKNIYKNFNDDELNLFIEAPIQKAVAFIILYLRYEIKKVLIHNLSDLSKEEIDKTCTNLYIDYVKKCREFFDTQYAKKFGKDRIIDRDVIENFKAIKPVFTLADVLASILCSKEELDKANVEFDNKVAASKIMEIPDENIEQEAADFFGCLSMERKIGNGTVISNS